MNYNLTIAEIYHLIQLSEEEFLKLCKVSNYQASGPGGQKRNRKLSAIRITHTMTQLATTSCEFREPQRNLSHALHRLRMTIALSLPLTGIQTRENPEAPFPPETHTIPVSLFRCNANESHPDFPGSTLVALHLFYINRGSLGETAKLLDTSSAALIKFFKKDKNLFRKVQDIRKEFELYPIK